MTISNTANLGDRLGYKHENVEIQRRYIVHKPIGNGQYARPHFQTTITLTTTSGARQLLYKRTDEDAETARQRYVVAVQRVNRAIDKSGAAESAKLIWTVSPDDYDTPEDEFCDRR